MVGRRLADCSHVSRLKRRAIRRRHASTIAADADLPIRFARIHRDCVRLAKAIRQIQPISRLISKRKLLSCSRENSFIDCSRVSCASSRVRYFYCCFARRATAMRIAPKPLYYRPYRPFSARLSSVYRGYNQTNTSELLFCQFSSRCAAPFLYRGTQADAGLASDRASRSARTLAIASPHSLGAP